MYHTDNGRLVNNAGISVESRREPQKLHETSEKDWNKTMDVNARSIFLMCKFVTAQMITQEPNSQGDRGWIINLSSIYGLVGGYNNGRFDFPVNDFSDVNSVLCCFQGCCYQHDKIDSA